MKTHQLNFHMLLIIFIAACNQQIIDQEAEAEKLLQLSREWAKTAQGDNLEKTLNYWAKNATVLSPDQPAIKGHEGIRQMLEQSAKIPGFEVNWEPKEAFVSQSGDLGYVIAHNYFKFPDSTGNVFTTYGRGVEIWRKQEDGSWKTVVDIFNGDPTLTTIK